MAWEGHLKEGCVRGLMRSMSQLGCSLVMSDTFETSRWPAGHARARCASLNSSLEGLRGPVARVIKKKQEKEGGHQ